MSDTKKTKLFLVDDDAVFLNSLEIDLSESEEFKIETYLSGEACIYNLDHQPDLIVLDYLLDGTDKTAMNGIETLDKIKSSFPSIPVIILSGQDKIEVAVSCMKHGALDYVVKSETSSIRLKKIIVNNFKVEKLEKQLNWYMDRM